MSAAQPLPGIRPGRHFVVTGGAGFIGGHLTTELLARGCRVTVLDDFSSGLATNLPAAAPGLTVTELHVGDAGRSADLQKAIAGADLVYHLASPIGVAHAHSSRAWMVRGILETSLAITAACRATQTPLLSISSSEVYGPGKPGPISESDPCSFDLSPRWGYATGKFALEQLTVGLTEQHGIPTWIVRPFNIAGPRQRPETGLCIAAFAAALKRGANPVVHGDGSQRRAFLHVADAVAALLLIPCAAALIGQPVNLGHPEDVSILDVATRMMRLAHRDGPPDFQPFAEAFGHGFAEAALRAPDLRRLISATGWLPRHDLAAILRDALD